MTKANMVMTVVLVLCALVMASCKESDKAAGKDEWKTGKYVPPAAPSQQVKLKPLPRFACKAVGPLSKWRYDPVVSLLSDGRVLVAGGRQRKEWLSSSEIFDPQTGKSVTAGAMKEPRALQGSVRLADGRVLVYGGGAKDLELFEPKSRAWRVVGKLKQEAVGVAGVQRADGKVYLAGGEFTGKRAMATSAVLWDPKTSKLTPLPQLKQGLRGTGFVSEKGEVVLLARQSEDSASKLMVPDPQKGTLTPFESEDLLFKALKELGRSKGGDQVKLAYGPDGKPILPPTGLREKALLRFFPSRMSWRSLAKLNHDHSGGGVVALSADRILVVGGADASSSVAEICTPES